MVAIVIIDRPASLDDCVADRVTPSWYWRLPAHLLAIDRDVVLQLMSKADPECLAQLHPHTDPSESVDILVGSDRISAWLGGVRISVMERP